MKYPLFIFLLLSCCLFAQLDNDKTAPALSRFQAHAHNDYLHDRPLYDALTHGFRSIEIDVWLIKDTLYVAHDRDDVIRSPLYTIENMYLDPLAELIRKDPNQFDMTVMIDVKSEADATYQKLDKALSNYAEMITLHTPKKTYEKPLHIVISGNRSRGLMLADSTRWATYDGRMEDLDSDLPTNFLWMISDKWGDYFDWQGNGEIPQEQFEKLLSITNRAARQKRKIRFWATPDDKDNLFSRTDRERVWRFLAKAGFIIGTDDLKGLSEFLQR